MHNEFLDAVEEALKPFEEIGFEPSLLHWDGDTFGNGYIVLKRRHVRLRVLRDRDHDILEMSPGTEPERWTDPEILLRAVAGNEEGDRYRSSKQLGERARVVFENLARLEVALKKTEWLQTRENIEMLEDVQRRRRFGF